MKKIVLYYTSISKELLNSANLKKLEVVNFIEAEIDENETYYFNNKRGYFDDNLDCIIGSDGVHYHFLPSSAAHEAELIITKEIEAIEEEFKTIAPKKKKLKELKRLLKEKV